MRHLSIIVIAAVAIASCSATLRLNDSYSMPESLVSAEQRADFLDDWFNCDECVNGQLRRVQELGDIAVSDLAAAYNGTVPDKTEQFTNRCERINVALIARGFPAQECALYAMRFQDNTKRRYQRRAFSALLAIRTKASCDEIGGEERCRSFDPLGPDQIEITTGRSTKTVVR